MPRIIDCHCHHLDDTDVEWARKLGYDKIVLMDWPIEKLKESFRKHPDFVIPVGYLPLQEDVSVVLDYVERYREMGCLGLKACGASARYDDERHYPVWAKAQEYRLPVFFHTGWLDIRLATGTFNLKKRSLWDFYHVMTLDRITCDFPHLKLVAFHMGGTYIADCSLLMRQWPNIYADSCIGLRADARDYFWGQIGGDGGGLQTLSKMVYGTDGMATYGATRDRIEEFQALFDGLKVPKGLQERIWHKNAQRIVGLDDELKKKVRVGAVKDSAMDLKIAARGGRLAGATRIADFTDRTMSRYGEPTRFGTTCWIGCDERALHMVFHCKDRNATKVDVSREGPVSQIWQDDSVEVFLSPGNNEDYRHFVVNAIGRASTDKNRGPMTGFDGKVESRIAKDGWTAKISIPFSLLGAKPTSGATWGLQLCRNKHTAPEETMTWSEVATTFHDPSSFGKMIFE